VCCAQQPAHVVFKRFDWCVVPNVLSLCTNSRGSTAITICLFFQQQIRTTSAIMQLNRVLFGILLLGIITVHGQSYIRFANAHTEFGSSYLGLAAQPYGPITGLQVEEAPFTDPLPFSSYLSVPRFGLPLNQPISFYLYDVYNGDIFTDLLVNATLTENQSYTFVAAGSDYAITLFSVEERPSNISLYAGKSVLKIVNAVESTYLSPLSVIVYNNGVIASSPQVPFGSSSNFLAFSADMVDVAVYLDFYALEIRNLTLQRDATTFIYLRGHNGTDSGWTVKVVPFSGPVAESPVASPVNNAPIGNTPVSAPSTAVIRLINAAYVPNTRLTAVMHTENYQFVNATSAANSSVYFYGDNIFGEYLTVPSNIPLTFVVDGYGLQRTLVLPTNSRSSLVFYNSVNGTQANYHLLYLDESPARASYPQDPRMRKYRVVNTRLFDTLRVYTSDWQESYVSFGSYVDIDAVNISVIIGSDYYGFSYFEQGQPDTLMTYYITGSTSDNSWFFVSDQTALPAPSSQGPICANGHLETTGYCNCYSGFTDDETFPNWHCTVPPPSWCQISNQTSTDSGPVPNLSNLQVVQGNLALRVYSAFSAGRRTYIEFPNSACNLINNPSYYTKTTSWDGCSDQFNVQIPFAACGFTKTSFSDRDVYRGDMHVKFIDTLTVNDETIERVIDTPFTLVVRLPKDIAIESSVEVIAAPVYKVPLTAALVGQKVNTATQTAQLVYVTSVPAQFIVDSVLAQQYPYGVNVTLDITSTNCTANFCLQHLTVDLDIRACDISGFYRFDILIVCRDQQNCPPDVQGAATITSTILAQRSCGDVSVDVGLHGSLQAYSSPSFTSQSLTFGPGQHAYFLVNTFSPQVVISRVTLDQVYYQGPYVQGHFLLTDGVNVSSRASHNNFTWGQLTSSQLWFSFDVTVSKLSTSDDTLFKINNGQSGVYSFMAVVEVEWLLPGTPTANVPITLPVPAPSYNSASPYPFKKRMVLQGTASQGSQFTAQVQIAGPDTSVQPSSTQPSSTQPEDGSVSTGTVLTSAFSLCVASVSGLIMLLM
jgi:hypothetical protein